MIKFLIISFIIFLLIFNFFIGLTLRESLRLIAIFLQNFLIIIILYHLEKETLYYLIKQIWFWILIIFIFLAKK